MTSDLHKALCRKGIDATICEWKSADDLVAYVRETKPDCTWSFNVMLEPELCFHPFGVPHVYVSVDAITYCHPCIAELPHLVCLFVDSSSVALYNQESAYTSYWFPHAISQEVLEERREQVPFEDRPYDVTLLGSYIPYEKELEFWKAAFPSEVVAAFLELSEKCLSDGNFMFLQEMSAFFLTHPELVYTIKTLGLFPHNVANSVERYIRGKDRERLLKTLEGHNIHIFTDEQDICHWAAMPYLHNATFHTAVPFDRVAQVCSQSKIILNSVPTIRKGYHERLFLALASEAVVVTSPVDLPSWLGDEGYVVKYDAESCSTLEQRISSALKFPKNFKKIRNWLLQHHTWDARLSSHLPSIEADVIARHAAWETNRFWTLLSHTS